MTLRSKSSRDSPRRNQHLRSLRQANRLARYVRVPARQSNTDIKASAGSGSIVLLLVPSGTVLPVLGRQGEWIQVRLSPELRQVGTPMRWYKNEEAGFVHDSTVEVFKK